MQEKHEFSNTNTNASKAMQHCILLLMNEPARNSDMYEMQLIQIKKYCENENVCFDLLEQNLNEYFELLDVYRNTKTRIFLRFLKLQARNCLIDDNNIDFLQIIRDEVNEYEDYYSCDNESYITSDTSQTSSLTTVMVGGHIIGL